MSRKDLERKEVCCLNLIKPAARSTIKAFLSPESNKEALFKFKEKFFNSSNVSKSKGFNEIKGKNLFIIIYS